MYQVTIASPSQIESKKTKKHIEALIKLGAKTNEIFLVSEFVAPAEVLNQTAAKFQVLKNRIAFDLRG